MSIKVTTPTMINGRGESSYTTGDLIELISSSVAEVKRLNDLGFESKTVAAMIERETKGQQAALKILDARKLED